MSTPSTVANTAARLSPSDTVPVLEFRTAKEDVSQRLNEDLGIALTPLRLHRLQTYFRTVLRRDPTVGELRMLDRLDSTNRLTANRIAVGELYTDSEDIADTWADMMQKQGYLHGVGEGFRLGRPRVSPPCTLDDALSLIGRYLLETCPTRRSYGERPILLSSQGQELEVAAGGYTLLTRLSDPSDTHAPLSVWASPTGRAYRAPIREGDIILYLPHISPERILALTEAERRATLPLVGDIRPLAGRSLLTAVSDMLPASEIYADRLDTVAPARTPIEGEPERSAKRVYVSVEALCDTHDVTGDGVTDYILCAPHKRALELADLLKSLRIPAILCGRVRHGDRTVVRAQNPLGRRRLTAMNVHTRYLRMSAPLHLRRFTTEGAVASRSAPTPLQLINATAISPNVWQANGTDMLLSASSLSLAVGEDGFDAAKEALLAVSRALTATVPPSDVTLSVTLTASSPEMLTEGVTLSAVCGLYRAAAELGLPIVSPVITTVPTDGDTLSVTVAAWSNRATH